MLSVAFLIVVTIYQTEIQEARFISIMVSEMLFHPVEGRERTEKLTSWQPRGRERQIGQAPAIIFKDTPSDIPLPVRPFPPTVPWFLEVVPPVGDIALAT